MFHSLFIGWSVDWCWKQIRNRSNKWSCTFSGAHDFQGKCLPVVCLVYFKAKLLELLLFKSNMIIVTFMTWFLSILCFPRLSDTINWNVLQRTQCFDKYTRYMSIYIKVRILYLVLISKKKCSMLVGHWQAFSERLGARGGKHGSSP